MCATQTETASVELTPADEHIEFSFVVPVTERHDDLVELYHSFASEAAKVTSQFEFLFVLDGGFQTASRVLKTLQKEDPRVRVIQLQGDCGESTALMIGFEKARGRLIFTLSAYFQVEAEEFGIVHQALSEGDDLVITRRFPRRDSTLNRFQARVFHWIISKMIGTSFKDISCGFRGMKHSVLENIYLYADLHRFLPALAVSAGFRVREVKVKQDQRDLGMRLRGPGVYLRRLIDILSLFFLVKFTKKPLRFFGLVGSALFGFGFCLASYVSIWKLAGNPISQKAYILLLGILCVVLGLQTIFLGLVGEIIIFTHAREMKDYQIESLEG